MSILIRRSFGVGREYSLPSTFNIPCSSVRYSAPPYLVAMQWINVPVELHNLPKIENLELQPVHPDYKKVLRFTWIITTLVLMGIGAALWLILPGRILYNGMIVVGIVLLLLSIFHRIYIEKSFAYLAYSVRTHDVIFQRGWITRSLRACPYRRIQNCSVQSGPIERRYGLATLIIYTAGSEGADMQLPGLEAEEADRLRHFIMTTIHKEEDDNTGLD